MPSSHAATLELLMVFGPTGVGKTTLLKRARQKLIEQHANILQTNRGLIPFAIVREFIAAQLSRAPRSTTTELGSAVRQALAFRKTKVLVIDEGQHLGKVANAKLLNHQVEQIKDLADETGALIVLTGTYDLIKLLNVTGQLCRRQEQIHFGRYRAESPVDVDAFRIVVRTFDETLPLPERSGLLDHYELLYTGSLGCTGMLKDWLVRALTVALDRNASRLNKAVLEDTIMEPTGLRTILTEIREGERNQYEPDVDIDDIAALLGLKQATPLCPSVPMTTVSKRKPGERLPSRDPVGVAA